jgi:hypothetical protein
MQSRWRRIGPARQLAQPMPDTLGIPASDPGPQGPQPQAPMDLQSEKQTSGAGLTFKGGEVEGDCGAQAGDRRPVCEGATACHQVGTGATWSSIALFTASFDISWEGAETARWVGGGPSAGGSAGLGREAWADSRTVLGSTADQRGRERAGCSATTGSVVERGVAVAVGRVTGSP